MADVDIINSAQEFLARLKVGDMFWHMTSLFGEPCNIVGPCRIREFYKSEPLEFLMVRYSRISGDCEGEDEHSVNDLTNRHHGVFVNETDALAYFAERKEAYATDPVLIAQVHNRIAEAERFDRAAEAGEDYWRIMGEF